MSKLHLNTIECRAYWGGSDVMLTTGEFRTLAKLASRPGRYITYREIYDAIQSPGFVAGEGGEGYRANVRSMVKRIRRKFQSIDPTFDAITNYMAFGYLLDPNIMQKPTCCPTCGQHIVRTSGIVVGNTETVTPLEDDWQFLLTE